ncbi:hypothetical protein RVR_3430 [Actinacidiphila reveromycinica]|uniref:Secreted protein n=1 Tax=Actinacidiphila reveromycinica TaxID=659352 RepID=A0A7U3UNQ7_9ACTN|nr:hypothetical protein [Streptomyces sp. SN-593]BBA97605.1 hypothetical protein RVR_3430 [Streptomyces sp. SN-593]
MSHRRTAVHAVPTIHHGPAGPCPAREDGGTATGTATATAGPGDRPRARAAALPVAALLLTALLTACQGTTRALDCVRTAATVAGDVQDLQSTATNIGQVSDPGRRKDTVAALDKVQKDLDRIGDRGDGSDVGHAVADLSASVRRARTTAADGRDPDLRPVASAAGRLTVVCARG